MNSVFVAESDTMRKHAAQEAHQLQTVLTQSPSPPLPPAVSLPRPLPLTEP